MNKADLLAQITHFLDEQIPFNKLLGLKITQFNSEESEIRFLWQDQLVGNPVLNILHGGVTASALDFAGGVVAAANIIESLNDINAATLQNHLSKLGTIDLRTDYLTPGKGKEFIVTAKIIRNGKRVAVARMEMHNEKGDHIACGTGTYIVG